MTIAVSSRTLFNLSEERKIYEEEGVEKYVAHQVEHENEPLRPGAAFPFVKVSADLDLMCYCKTLTCFVVVNHLTPFSLYL